MQGRWRAPPQPGHIWHPRQQQQRHLLHLQEPPPLSQHQSCPRCCLACTCRNTCFTTALPRDSMLRWLASLILNRSASHDSLTEVYAGSHGLFADVVQDHQQSPWAWLLSSFSQMIAMHISYSCLIRCRVIESLQAACQTADLLSTAAAAAASRCLQACSSALASSLPGPYKLANRTLSTCIPDAQSRTPACHHTIRCPFSFCLLKGVSCSVPAIWTLQDT